MADVISSGTNVPDSDFSNDLFYDADDSLFLNLREEFAELRSFLDDEDELSDQQNIEGTSLSKLDRDWGYIYGSSSGNYGGGSGTYTSSECRSVGSEALSQTSVQGFQPGIAYYGQGIATDESTQNSVLRPGEENVTGNIHPFSSNNYEADECPSLLENDNMQSGSIIDLKDETCEMNFQVPELGMVFSSQEEAYKFYNNYATKKGFKVRKGKTQRLTDGTIRKRYLFCSKQGFRSENKSGRTRKYQRKDTRIGCEAMVQFTHDTESGKWVITRIVLEHNHDTNVPNQRHGSFPSANISEENAGINATNKGAMVEETVVVHSSELFPVVDPSNYYLCNEKINNLPPEDSQSLVNFLDHLQLEDPSFFYTVQLDAGSRVINFFWRDGRSKIDYEYFGDVLILDTTSRIEKYDIICALLLGVNHHQQYILFGCAFLLDDSMGSFVWLFRTFLKAMGERQPRTIFTDERQAVSDAVKLELCEAQHRLGMWYIRQNARKHLSAGSKLSWYTFSKCISDCDLKWWDQLYIDYNFRENSWFSNLYNMRRKQPHVFSNCVYSAGIGSLQGWENRTNVFHNLMSETITLSKFVQQCLRATEQWRTEELHEDFRCNASERPMILKDSELEKQAADVYTSKIFKLFQEELHECQSFAVEQFAKSGRLVLYEIIDKHTVYNLVEFDCLTSNVTCTCKKFESIGVLCAHALKVLGARNIRVPSQYILKRWTKSAKDGMVADDHKQQIADQSRGQSSSFTCRLMDKAFNIITKSVAVEENQKIVENHLDMALKEVENVLKRTRHPVGKDGEIHHRNGSSNDIDCIEGETKVPNPPCSGQQESPKLSLDFTLKRKEENEATLTERESSDDAVICCRPLKEARKDGDDRTRSGSPYRVGENSQKQPCMPTENMQEALQRLEREISKLKEKIGEPSVN